MKRITFSIMPHEMIFQIRLLVFFPVIVIVSLMTRVKLPGIPGRDFPGKNLNIFINFPGNFNLKI